MPKSKNRTKRRLDKNMWVEKYRPDSIAATILPTATKRYFNKVVKEGEMDQNLLLYSTTPGSGKTTISKALCADLGVKPFYINISNERGIAVLRNDIARHAKIKTVGGKTKIVILDEFDGATKELQDALRADMEKYSNSCRFIMTCNYISKIIEPLREGRTTLFDFNMTDAKTKKDMAPKVVKRLCKILEVEKVQYEKEVIEQLVETCYPNIRKMISTLQKCAKMYDIIDENVLNMTTVDNELYDLIMEKDLTEARRFILNKNYNFDEMYTDLYKNFVPLLERDVQPQAIVIIAQYQYESAFAINKEIPLMACLIDIMSDCL